MTAGTPLTSGPPEDSVIDRVLMTLKVSSDTLVTLGVGLILVDRTWTPSGTTGITPDLDKRFLWWRSWLLRANETWEHTTFVSAAGVVQPNAMPPETNPCWADISPKVRIEDGKHLAVATYCSVAATVTMTAPTVRILMHRAGRR